MMNLRKTGLVALALSAISSGCVSASVTSVSTYTSPNGHFSATVPNGKMEESSQVGNGHFQGATVWFYVNDQPDGTRFAVFTSEATDGSLPPANLEAAFDEFDAANVRATSGRQVAERTLTISGLPGHEQEIEASSATYVFRSVISGNRAWQFSVKGSNVTAHQAMSLVFLDSFSILP
jgi:hypothetical protein